MALFLITNLQYEPKYKEHHTGKRKKLVTFNEEFEVCVRSYCLKLYKKTEPESVWHWVVIVILVLIILILLLLYLAPVKIKDFGSGIKEFFQKIAAKFREKESRRSSEEGEENESPETNNENNQQDKVENYNKNKKKAEEDKQASLSEKLSSKGRDKSDITQQKSVDKDKNPVKFSDSYQKIEVEDKKNKKSSDPNKGSDKNPLKTTPSTDSKMNQASKMSSDSNKRNYKDGLKTIPSTDSKRDKTAKTSKDQVGPKISDVSVGSADIKKIKKSIIDQESNTRLTPFGWVKQEEGSNSSSEESDDASSKKKKK